jgi:hypothetical protein
MGQQNKKLVNFNLNPPKIGSEYLKYGLERIEYLMVKSDKNTNYLPKSITLNDIDDAIFDFVNNKDMKLILDGKDVPVIYLTNERWAEFSKTWQYVDLDKNLLTPFITIVRSNMGEGSRLGNKFNFAQRRTFRYLDVPIFDEGQTINLRFKIPEPTNVDLFYDVKLFTKYQEDINAFDEKVLFTFASRQAYTFIKGNPMVILHDGQDNENTVEDVKGDRMYVKKHSLKVLGFIQNEENFEIVKTTRLPNIAVNVSKI